MNNEDTEPPDSLNYSKKSSEVVGLLEQKVDESKQDKEGILLEPDIENGELAVFNLSLYQGNNKGPWPAVWRSERQNEKRRYSVINFGLLLTPTKLSKEKRTIIKPEYDWEEFGCEDPKLTKKDNTYHITYIAWDGLNARIARATTKDFINIEKHGLMGSVDLYKAIQNVGDEAYKRKWWNDYKGTLEWLESLSNKDLDRLGIRKRNLYLWDKDATLKYNEETQEWELEHRWDPCMQIAKTKNLEDFNDINFWIYQLQNINQHTSLKNEFPWASKKIGWGSTTSKLRDKLIGLLHGVNKKNRYCCSFYEKKNGRIESVLKKPLIRPNKEDKFVYKDGNRRRTKSVVFTTAKLITEDRIWIYLGSADTRIKYRTTNPDWLYAELNHPSNKVNQ